MTSSTIIALLGPSGAGKSQAYAINDSGSVVGIAYFSSQYFAGDWTNGTSTELYALSGQLDAFAYAINDEGQAVGYVSQSNGAINAVLWQDGAQALLGSLGGVGNFSEAKGINDSGVIVGETVNAAHSETVACVWQNGVQSSLPNFVGSTVTADTSCANAINDSGQIVGYGSAADGMTLAALWQNGTLTDLGVLPGNVGSIANAINNHGEVVGTCSELIYSSQAFYWVEGTMAGLPGLFNGGSSAANDVNESGVIVGNATVGAGANSAEHAVMWQNGAIVDLNSLLPTNSNWVLTDARSVNDDGQIAGVGLYNGVLTAYELTLGSAAEFVMTTQEAVQSRLTQPVPVSDNAANVAIYLDSLQPLVAAGKVSGITLSDSGFATLSITPAQLTSDSAALSDVTGNFVLDENASGANLTFTGLVGHGNIAVFSGVSSEYSIAPASDGQGVVVTDTGTGRSSVDTLMDINALRFADLTDIVAQAPSAGAAPTTGNITELYGAVFGRLPDIPGLAFYEAELKAHPSLPLTQFAQYFLASPEYTGNPAHDYAPSIAGDTQFITDCYTNLLHRSPEAGAIPFYLNVISQFTQTLTPGTSAYTAAETLGHAYVITYFSASQEFLNDVQVTAGNPTSAQHWLVLI